MAGAAQETYVRSRFAARGPAAQGVSLYMLFTARLRSPRSRLLAPRYTLKSCPDTCRFVDAVSKKSDMVVLVISIPPFRKNRERMGHPHPREHEKGGAPGANR
jgi:hypothetical protein